MLLDELERSGERHGVRRRDQDRGPAGRTPGALHKVGPARMSIAGARQVSGMPISNEPRRT